MKTAILVVCSPERLNQFNILLKSIKEHCPGIDILLYFGGDYDPKIQEATTVINFSQHVKNSVYKDPMYTYCSLRPKAVLDAFSKGYDRIWLLGADTEFFGNPKALYEALETNDMFVTMYTHEPFGDEENVFPNDWNNIEVGQIQGDCVGFSKNDKVIKFLNWLDKKVETKCFYKGKVYVDQVWMSACFSFLDKVAIIRDLGYNVGSFNAIPRGLHFNKEWQMEDGTVLVLYHYDGIEKGKEENISRHQNRFKATSEYLQFLKNYTEKL